jgi:DNA-binding NtrC family response regulator
MPGGISGVELARAIRQRHPRVGVLLTTGYPGGAQEAVRAGLPLIRKPYQLGELGHQIGASLVQRSAALPASAAAESVLPRDAARLVGVGESGHGDVAMTALDWGGAEDLRTTTGPPG